MARGFIRKTSFWKIVGAFRSQWKRKLKRMFIPGYGKRGMGWWRNPKKAMYSWWYNRSSVSVYRMFGGKSSHGTILFAMVFALFANVFAAPVDITKAVAKASKIKKARKARAERNSSRSSNTRTTSKTSTNTASETTRQSVSSSYESPKDSSERTFNNFKTTTTGSPPRRTTSSSSTKSHSSNSSSSEKNKSPQESITNDIKVTPETVEQKKTWDEYAHCFSNPSPKNECATKVVSPKNEVSKELDENTPKSKPKNDKDQYIRKRMIIAGSSYCDPAVLEKLKCGTYFDLEAEPDNPNDKDAVKLTLDGQKIGYIAKADRMAFVTCLKMKRSVYGVITDIKNDSFSVKYEFETWFDRS